MPKTKATTKTTKAAALTKGVKPGKSDFTPVPPTKEVNRTVPEPKPKPAKGQAGTKRQPTAVAKAVKVKVEIETVAEFEQPEEVVVGRHYEVSPLDGPRVYGELIESIGKKQTLAVWDEGRLTDKIADFDFTQQPVREIDRTTAHELTTHAHLGPII